MRTLVGAVLILCGFSSSAAYAGWSHKAFEHHKLQLASKAAGSHILVNDELLVLADVPCLVGLQAQDKTHADPFRSIGLAVKHKTLSGLQVEAFAAHATETVSLTELEAGLNQHPCIIGVSENPVVQTNAVSDPFYTDQRYLPSIGYDHGQKFFFHPLWGGRAPVTVGIVDSGIDTAHEDLAQSLWTGLGYDFVNGDADPMDDFGHGTHVSGIIAATRDNGVGIRGILGSTARIMAIKSQGADGNGTMADVVNAIRWAADNGAEVLNLSLASTMQNQALLDALQYALSKQVFIAVAAGNAGQEITATNFISPVGYAKDYSGIVGVGSIDALNYARSPFSNFGPTYVEMSAPGAAGTDGIFSTFLNSTYRSTEGTSMSSPQVAAAAAAALSFLKTRGEPSSPDYLESILKQSAIRQSSNLTYFQGGQRADIERLGHLLFNTYVIDSTGGFDVP